MKKDKPENKISRRKFISSVGTGVAGSYLATLPLNPEKSQSGTKRKNSHKCSFQINSKQYTLNIEPETTLAELLRDHLQLKGTKIACNHGECGACTVLLDGQPVYSCHILAVDADNRHITTIEGLAKGNGLHPVQAAFVENDGLQCGFCTPGQIMSAYGLLLHNPNPTDPEIKRAMSGNLCRCAAYPNILKSVKAAAQMMAREG